MHDLLTASVTELARRIREGEVTSTAVVDAHIRRIEAVNPVLNAVVQDRFDDARAEADRADDALRTGDLDSLPPLHGVPCTIKECFEFTGMPWTTGLVRRKGIVGKRDAPAVARLRQAGAIPLGVTNTSELCMWMESDNRVYGRTNNPYDLARIVGGSSGGEAAIIAAGGSPFGLGSDVGGSIRLPAFFNGVFGHKCTGTMVPNAGQYPPAEGDVRRYLTTGPLCRRGEDLFPLLRILAGPHDEDPTIVDWELIDPDEVDLSTITVFDIPDNGRDTVHADLQRAQRDAAEHLAGIGLDVRTARPDGFRNSFDIWASMLATSNETPFAVLMGQGTAISPVRELVKLAMGRSEHTIMASMLALTESVTSATPWRTRKYVERGRVLRNELVDLLGDTGVALFPSYTLPAPHHGVPVRRQLRFRFDYAYTCVLNALELPSTQVPLGLNESGVPVGIQVVAAHGRDHLTLAVARELERAFGGWVWPADGPLGLTPSDA